MCLSAVGVVEMLEIGRSQVWGRTPHTPKSVSLWRRHIFKEITNDEVLTWENIIYGNHICEAEPLLTPIYVSALSGIFAFLATLVLQYLWQSEGYDPCIHPPIPPVPP